jgi:uncharacterized protein (TIGR02246 family)
MEPTRPEDWWPRFQDAMRAGDLAAVLRLYEPEAAFANPAGQVRRGHVALREEFAPNVSGRADFVVNVRKIIQSGDLALVHSEWRITRPRAASGYALEVLRRQVDGRWLLAIGDPFTVGRWAEESESPALPGGD